MNMSSEIHERLKVEADKYTHLAQLAAADSVSLQETSHIIAKLNRLHFRVIDLIGELKGGAE